MDEQDVDDVSLVTALLVGVATGRRLRRPSIPLPAAATLQRLGAVGGLLLLTGAFFWQVVIGHRVLLPFDILQTHDPLWHSGGAQALARPANPLDSDALTEFYPWLALSWTSLHQGVLPLWNPYSFAGTPFLASMQTAVLYPVQFLLEWIFAPPTVLGARAIVHLALILTGTYLFARRLSLSHAASLLSAVCWGLSLPVVVWLEHPIASAIAWLPWLLIGIDHLCGEGHSAWALVAMPLLVATEILAGHGESTAHIVLLCTGYALYKATSTARSGRTLQRIVHRLLVCFGLAVIGGAIAAVHLIPSLVQIAQSEAASDRAFQASASGLTILGTPGAWSSLLFAALPELVGSPTWRLLLPATGDFNETALYIGSVPLVLAVLGLVRRRRETWPFGLFSLIALGLAVHLPVFDAFNTLPVLRVMENGRLRIEYAFTMALLAGYGLDALALPRSAVQMCRYLAIWTVLVALIAAGGSAVLIVVRRAPPLLVLHLWLPIVWLILCASVLAWSARRESHASLPWLILSLAIGDLFALGVGYHATASHELVTTTPPAIRYIQRDHSVYRVVGLGSALLPAMSSLYGLEDIRGYDPAYNARYETFFGSSFDAPRGMRLVVAPFGPSPTETRALNLLNVTYVLAGCNVSLNPVYFRRVYRGEGCVYRNLSSFPRAFIVHHAVSASPHDASLLLGRGIIDPRRTVLLQSLTSGPNRRQTRLARRCRDTVTVVYKDVNTARLSACSTTRGYLLLSDADARGWVATIDGAPTPVLRADAVLRAVHLPPGRHVVLFTYRPAALSIGLIISGLGLLSWISLCLFCLRHNRARTASGQSAAQQAVYSV